MRWLLALAVLISLSSFAANSPGKQQEPVMVALVVPADYAGPVAIADADLIVRLWVSQAQAWYLREVGKTFTIRYAVVHSHYTKWDLQREGYFADACGDGLDINFVFPNVTREVAAALGITLQEPYRLWYVVLGGGGWAGGNWFGPNPDAGFALLGDWALRIDATGEHPPCAPGWVTGGGWAFGHEALNSMGVGPYDPYVGLDDPLAPFQKRNLVRKNKNFLREP